MPEPCLRCGGTGVEPDDEAVGREMRELRKRSGLTLREVARRIEVSPTYLSDLELGKRHWAPVRDRFIAAVCATAAEETTDA